jgi:hypothetical protein
MILKLNYIQKHIFLLQGGQARVRGQDEGRRHPDQGPSPPPAENRF